MPVTYRMTVEEGLPGSLTLQEGCIAAGLLSKEPINDIHVVAGNYGTNQLVIPPYFKGAIANKPRLQAVREAVGPDFPLAVAGRITNVFQAESLVQDGLAQFVAMGRASLADPELPNRSMAGEYDTVRTCIGCNDGCVGRTKRSVSATCVVNPTTGHEAETDSRPKPAASKKVLVVGAGPAGLETAWIAARRGHKVTVCEKDGRVGGQFLLAAVPSKKMTSSPISGT